MVVRSPMKLATAETYEGASPSTTRAPVVLHTRVVTGEGGGPEKTILNSPRYLEGYGYRSLCAYMHPPHDPGFRLLTKRALQSGTQLLSIPDRGIQDLRVLKRLLRICRAEHVSIWHAHDYKSNAIGLVLRRFWPMRLVTTVHGWVKFTRRTPLYYWLDRQCLRRYERIICVSDDLLETCCEIGVPPDRCQLVHNGIDTKYFQRQLSTVSAKAMFGLPTSRFVIGAVGRLSAEKAFRSLIRVTSQLIDAGHDVQLIIAGEGDERPSLAALIESQREPDRFRLLGHRCDVREVFQAMDVFVLSSLREGLPNVLLEAMALEVPVIATRIAGVPDLVTSGENGRLISPADEWEMFDAISSLLRNPDERTRFSKAARRTIEQRFSFAERMQKIQTIYDELL